MIVEQLITLEFRNPNPFPAAVVRFIVLDFSKKVVCS